MESWCIYNFFSVQDFSGCAYYLHLKLCGDYMLHRVGSGCVISLFCDCFQIRISRWDGPPSQQRSDEEHRSRVCVGLWSRRVLGIQPFLPPRHARCRGLSKHQVGRTGSAVSGPATNVLPEMSWSAVVCLVYLLQCWLECQLNHTKV